MNLQSKIYRILSILNSETFALPYQTEMTDILKYQLIT